ncbi:MULTISPECIES: glutathione S-transferase N-terminal domain-containing protein [unclassified Dyella]|uniref:glutathione S-transferase family protein n=1 Tax=unclassified Dyella TaxID=2634549 RepID=UPI000C849269|nr:MULTISPECIES: glutathione S-transferase N-terminal domain-containing protein [unclassified Dyella]MDR3446314.1 glutathione S-transferase N-terminal domain-containing protein [Dyella sp.]PMQ02769.1 Glutathione S-transferase GST-4.5 [Dyella sp. AD56]
MKLYYLPGACSLSDHIVLEWIGQPYESHRVAREELGSPAYLQLNPSGMVPALQEPDGWVLTENVAILNYLADKFPLAGLGGEGARGRAEVNRWLAYLNSDLHPLFKPVFRPERFIDDTAAQEALRDKSIQRLRAYYERIDTQLHGRDWLTGTRSFADPYLFVVLRWAMGKGVDLSGLDNLARFHRRMMEDAGVKAAMEQEGL